MPRAQPPRRRRPGAVLSRATVPPPLPTDPAERAREVDRRARHAHLSELVVLLEREIGDRAIHTAVDEETGFFTAWLGPSYHRAKPHERAMDRTEAGTVRKLLNAIRRARSERMAIVVVTERWR